MKAKAWMNLSDVRARGVKILSGDVTKHKNDIARLTPFVTARPVMPESIQLDMHEFWARYDNEPIDGRELRLPVSVVNVKAMLHRLLG